MFDAKLTVSSPTVVKQISLMDVCVCVRCSKSEPKFLITPNTCIMIFTPTTNPLYALLLLSYTIVQSRVGN